MLESFCKQIACFVYLISDNVNIKVNPGFRNVQCATSASEAYSNNCNILGKL